MNDDLSALDRLVDDMRGDVLGPGEVDAVMAAVLTNLTPPPGGAPGSPVSGGPGSSAAGTGTSGASTVAASATSIPASAWAGAVLGFIAGGALASAVMLTLEEPASMPEPAAALAEASPTVPRVKPDPAPVLRTQGATGPGRNTESGQPSPELDAEGAPETHPDTGTRPGTETDSNTQTQTQTQTERKPDPEVETTADTGTTLPTEARLLLDARRALAAQPAETLRLTAAHRAAFPAGQLALERETLALEAELALGRDAEARQRATAIVARWPRSSYASSVRQRGLLDAP